MILCEIFNDIAKTKKELESTVSFFLSSKLFERYEKYEGELSVAYNGVCRDVDIVDEGLRLSNVSDWAIYFKGHINNVQFCAKIRVKDYVEKFIENGYHKIANYHLAANIADAIGVFMINDLLKRGCQRGKIKMWQWRCDAMSFGKIKEFYLTVMPIYLKLLAETSKTNNPPCEWLYLANAHANGKWYKADTERPRYTTIPNQEYDCSQIFRLREKNESIRQIAAITGIPKSTVQRKLAKAK